jgi:hypothetical protein
MGKEPGEQINNIKNFEQFINENERKFLPLNSLEWDFWNQSRSRIYKDDVDGEFNNYTKLLMDNLLNIVKTENLSLDHVLDHLKKFWDESIKQDYIDMHDNRDRFNNFRDKVRG